MKSDIEIAHEAELLPIDEVARKAGIPCDQLEHYGRYIAKVPYSLIDEARVDQSNLILVTAITPTKAGNGKTTVTVGLAQGLCRLGKRAIAALREPSMGPVFGMKGGAAGGGYSQVLPMDKINLHFTGEFHAVTEANNLISALLDNYCYRHQAEGFGLREVLWRRAMDMNDRSLRQVVTGLGAYTNGITSESGFDITSASELMAIMCLASSEQDLKERVGRILLGATLRREPFTVAQLKAAGAVTAVMHDAINPNLVQTLEHTPAFIHGGPFANIAHGCNSVLATKLAMTFGDYAVTEAGFGADLGAEKFFDIKCRVAGLQPKLSVLVVTTQALKMHGGVDVEAIRRPNAEGIAHGLANMERHIANLQKFGQTVVVALNRYGFDSEAEIDIVRCRCQELGVGFAVNDAFARGGEGAEELAQLVVDTIATQPSQPLRFAYADHEPVATKIEKVATGIYGARRVVFSSKALRHLKAIEANPDYACFPVCIAKTQYSFSDDATRYGVPTGFTITISDFVVNAGAGMVVAIAGSILRMPGLPEHPAAEHIDVVDGHITGLS